MSETTDDVEWRQPDQDEGRRVLEAEAQRLLGISREEFIATWDTGSFNGQSRSRAVRRVASLLPFGR
jgi:hypothetical protein